MRCIKGTSKNTIIINKSEFISSISFVENVSEAEEFLDSIRKKYPKASHNCYAYIVGSIEKCSDDGEPSRTAGIPILEVLKKKDLGNIVCVVTRFFGGIKLGAGGLIRAYSSSCGEAIDLVKQYTLEQGCVVQLTLDYANVVKVEYFLKNYGIIEYGREFNEKVIFVFDLIEEDLQYVKDSIDKINYLINFEILRKIKIPKEINE